MDPTQTQDVYREILKHVDDAETLKNVFVTETQKLEQSFEYDFLKTLILDAVGEVKTKALIEAVRPFVYRDLEVLKYIFQRVIFPVQRRKAMGLPPRAIIWKDPHKWHMDFQELCINHVMTTMKKKQKAKKQGFGTGEPISNKYLTCVVDDAVTTMVVSVEKDTTTLTHVYFELPHALFEALKNYDSTKIRSNSGARRLLLLDPRAKNVPPTDLENHIHRFWNQFMFQLYYVFYRPLELKATQAPSAWPAGSCWFLVKLLDWDFRLPTIYTTDFALAVVSNAINSVFGNIGYPNWPVQRNADQLLGNLFYQSYLNQDSVEVFADKCKDVFDDVIWNLGDLPGLIAESGKQISASSWPRFADDLSQTRPKLVGAVMETDWQEVLVLPAQPVPWDQILNT